ncbi:MAG: lamin tail domain-containing protein [Clostridia bacterium]|nr:lamin tail domain-containing protein [Clostridia bacterium]
MKSIVSGRKKVEAVSQTGRSGRRGASRERDEQVRARKRRRRSLVYSLITLAALLTVLVMVTPKEPQKRAYYTAGSEDGLVHTSGEADKTYEGLVISEVMASNHTSVPDETGNYPDWVEVWNSSDHEIPLEGVGLSDDGNSIRFLFPKILLPADGRVIVYCDKTNQAEAGRPLHAKFKLSSVGETVYLFDPKAFLIDSVSYRIVSSDSAWARMEDGSFREVSYYSPGYPNTEEGYLSYRNDTLVVEGSLIINEIMASARSGLADEDGEFSDWVELYNTTDSTISLDNYALSNKESKPLKWRFPQGAVVAPHSYYLVFCSGKDRREDVTAIPHASFRISGEHDTIVLSDGNGHLVDRVSIDNLPTDCSYARESTGSFTVHQYATPGRDNDDIAGADYDLRQRNRTGVYITEVMASNDSTALYQDSPYVDWIELYNAGSEAVDLSGYGLSDSIKRPRKWQFPQGCTIGPGEYKLILCDGTQVASSPNTIQHTNYRILRAGGEIICLSDPQGRILDKLVLPLIPTNVSYGRTLGMSGFFYYDVPTPGKDNESTGFLGYCETPAFSEAPGLYYAPVSVKLTVPEGTTVYYTTDGSIPTVNSKLYRGESFDLSFTSVIRARAFSDRESVYHPSEILTGTFFINAYHTLPIVSVVTDPDELWNPNTGMLVTGEGVVKEPGVLPFKGTVYREYGKIPRPVHVEYYSLDGETILNQDAQFSLMGDFSLDMPQKSMKFRSKSLYGSKYFDAALFDDRPYTEYKSFVLRNSGNDSMWTRLLDGFESRLLDFYGTSVIQPAWNPVVVYLNGTYWGHMNMRERVDRFFVAQFEGLDMREASQMTILEASGSLKYGTTQDRRDYRTMINNIKAGDPNKNPSDLQYILDNVDVDNYFEYIALEMFVGNSDIGNIRFYRLKQEGSKWKWIWYDADYGLYNSSFNSPWSYTKATGMGQKSIDNTILLKLLTVPEYKDKFLLKFGDIFKTFTTENMLEVLHPLVELITPEMQLHWARWGEYNDPYVISEVPTTGDGAYRYWEKRIQRLENTLKKRPNLLWGYAQEAFSLSDEEMIHYFGERPPIPEDAV